MISGLLIKQSLINLDILGNVNITKEEEWNIDDATEGQDSKWNVVWFEFEDERVDRVCKWFAENLKEGKWFVDFRDQENVYVVFKDRVFKYKKGDKEERSKVETYALDIGIPKTQLGWEE